MKLKQYGTNYGGFYYPDTLDGLNENSIIYCVGAGEDISHDIEIAHQLNSSVYIFDPTPRAIQHVNYIKNIYNDLQQPINNKNFGGGDDSYMKRIIDNKINTNKFIFHNYGLYIKDDIMKFYMPSNENYVSHSLVKGMKGEKFINVEVKTLNTIMKELNHNKIDLLKIDIEGSECDVIEKMINDKIFPKYLSVDFDLGWHGEKIKDRERCMNTIKLLQNNGYGILNNTGSDYSFMYSN
jgi:FkbM family methyltransferase